MTAKPTTNLISILGLGLSRNRINRLKEEFLSDFEADPAAKKTATRRVLQSYLSVGNLSSLVVFVVAAIAIVATLKSSWIWATCLVLISLFIVPSENEQNFASKSFKIYKTSLLALVALACYISASQNNLDRYPQILGLSSYFGNYPVLLISAVACVTSISLIASMRKSSTKWPKFQQLTYVLVTLSITFSSSLFSPISYLLFDLVATSTLFLISIRQD